MLHRLLPLLFAALRLRPRDVLAGLVVAALVVALAAISLGFATVAGFLLVHAAHGPVVASLVISAAYALAAGGVAALPAWRRGAPPRPTPPDPAPAPAIEALLHAIATAAGTEDPAALDAVLRAGREVSATERLVVALVSGFFAGRTLGR